MKRGLNSLDIKLIAVMFMTIDHIGSTFYHTMGFSWLRMLGRIAAPLFLFVVINSAHHVNSKLRFAVKLYIAHVIVCIITLLCSTVFVDIFGNILQFSILSTFSYTVLLVWIIENIIYGIKDKVPGKTIAFGCAMAGIIIVPIVCRVVFPSEILAIIIPDILTIEYTPIFVIMGIIWYFTDNKVIQSMVLVIFSFISLIGSYFVNTQARFMFRAYFSHIQFWMILAIFFMLLYNGERGKNVKKFFYIYYPAHYLILEALSNIIN